MFNRLRNRFLLMNMIIISLIMFAAFFSIYSITVRDVYNGIRMDLRRVEEPFNRIGGLPMFPPKDGGGFQGGGFKEGERQRSVSFVIRVNKDWDMTETSSRFDIGEEMYAAALQQAASDPDEFGQVTFNDTRWAYSVTPTPDGYTIVYLDITPQQRILTNLIYSFSAVAVVTLGLIYLASRYFAGRYIEPIKEAFEKQKRFIADASHELKTPLAVINTNADVLLANGEETINQQSKWLHHIKSEAERMKTLTNDLLYLTQMEDHRSSVLQAPFDLSEAVDSIILTMEAVIYEKQLNLQYDIEPHLIVNGSSEQMKQVVMILLDNAVKYTPSQGSIEVSLRRSHNHIQLTVSNTGPGIKEEQLERIFDRFYRADASRSRQSGGYGLGLAIAKAIVEQHRGKIMARSKPNEQTTIIVQLNG